DLIRDGYSDNEYRRLVRALRQSELRNLGTVELKSNNKHLLATVTRAGIVIALVLFLIVGMLGFIM
ncbi:MAG: hypothetical protein AAGC88_15840, partial [Bacteroidota bacterium]